MRVLVTGATGQVGRAVVPRLADAGHEVLPWSLRDRGVAGLPASLDAVVHLGAQTNAYVARADIGRDVRDSLVPFVDLLGAVADPGRPPLVILAGTVTQAAGTDRHSPATFYDVAKSAAQLYLVQAAAEGWVRAVTLRLANVYGGAAGDDHRHPRGFLNACIARAMAGEAITVYGDGEQLRDYLHVDDLAALVATIVDADPSPMPVAVDVGSGTSIALIEAVRTVVEVAHEVTGHRSPITHLPWPDDAYAVERRSTVVDLTALQAAFAWTPTVGLQEGIRRSIHARTAR